MITAMSSSRNNNEEIISNSDVKLEMDCVVGLKRNIDLDIFAEDKLHCKVSVFRNTVIEKLVSKFKLHKVVVQKDANHSLLIRSASPCF